MNGKFEERLARLAFGDMTPEEARGLELEAQKNPEAARVLTEYRAMRDGLRGLGADVPPDQLSKERLRDAILAQGLRPAPVAEPAPNRGWLWMPVLAGALAFGIFTFRGGSSSGTPTVVMDETKGPNFAMSLPEPKASFSVDLPERTTEPVVEKAAAQPQPKPVLQVASNVTEAPKPTRRRKRSRRGTIIIDASLRADTSPTVVAKGGDSDTSVPMVASASEPPTTDPSPVAMTASTSGPIVLIDSRKNEDTGASTATEVGTASNVLVGG